jgi:hypothetical protein
MSPQKRIFSYEDAVALLPEVQRLTRTAVTEVETLLKRDSANTDPVPAELAEHYQRIVGDWAAAIMSLGIEVKGLWLIDFDNGGGYYCWRYPETSLQYFHGYDEGFRGRVKLN